MAGVLKVRTIINITGLGDEVSIDTGDITMTVPVEHGGSGRYIVHATATTTAIQVSELFPQIALTKMYGMYLESVSGTIYVKLNTAGTTTFDASGAYLTFNEGEGSWIPIEPSNNAGITIDAASATDAFVITVVGKE